MAFNRTYENDGSGRDTFVNHAGAYWLNPLPQGVFFRSVTPPPQGGTASGPLASLLDAFGTHPNPGKALYGRSRYGTTVLNAPAKGVGGPGMGLSGPEGGPSSGRTSPGEPAGLASPGAPSGLARHARSRDGETWDPDDLAIRRALEEVPDEARRLRVPGHATTLPDLAAAGVESRFGGTPGPWEAPRAVDLTLVRVAPTYESTCHYGLRTGRYYTADQAPPHAKTLPGVGLPWGKSRSY
ncbi:unnamed protein product [Phytomonas sp. EM1]|nr:unnamed protein product [Phytomonas sp. EM1]|eukprot:CCW62358.1 unnamed protein product [Phytomonas sp. isolate EM1]